ncbi:hypothetical protein VN97_g1927 [Penicillium thymicola]|uniref:GATA-type domain-containing protein n=1 Tax=Penicillium thymicola TaxID=293382 RepID=A0AAI9TQ12_PENTH|nr:hypothetical protein VN97_g1927 [Penicillium thymicola]
MAPSQPEYASEDEDHEMLDYPETHDSGSEFLMSEDDTDYTDAEPNGPATDSENNSEHSPEDHDTESIPGIDDPSRDNALASPEYIDLYSTKDLVESDLEENEDDEDNEDNDTEDSDDESNALRAQYFPRTTLDLDKESKDVCLDRFNQRLGSVLEFLAAKANETASGKSGKWWIGGDFAQPLGKYLPEEVLDIFEYVIPESTRVILGSAELTLEHILALPIVDTSLDLPGVYLIAFLKTSGELPQLSGGESTNSTDTMDQQSWAASGLYGGSSLKSVSKRCVDHRKLFKSTSTVKLVKGRWKPNGKPNSKPVMVLYCYANINKVVPSYRQVCVFPARLEMFDDLPRMDINWMARLLEQAMILLLDIYTPCKDPELRETIGYTQEMYLDVLEQCKIPLSVFYPLNHAMPLKQSNIRTSGRRVCHHCAAKKSGANAWYRHPDATEEKPLYYCSACYVYQSLHTSDRPAALFNGPRSRPTAGPCSHCAVTESVTWCWHWRDKDHVVCLSCRSYWLKHRVDRPMKKEKKKCTSCGATETKGHWHCAYDASGQKTGDDWCSVCAMQNNRDINREAKKNNYANCACSVCGLFNLPA